MKRIDVCIYKNVMLHYFLQNTQQDIFVITLTLPMSSKYLIWIQETILKRRYHSCGLKLLGRHRTIICPWDYLTGNIYVICLIYQDLSIYQEFEKFYRRQTQNQKLLITYHKHSMAITTCNDSKSAELVFLYNITNSYVIALYCFSNRA